ncbi:glycosyltransferase involved in cell wall biosynthesis/cellulose synthase/poly-beta-1,6-N-acetylglucosamine synthase-like glycosyltransferase [Desulfobaculum xiamenense]|uniref:Glycosyltransferase involved in cell wall biosynthesis/cellulose synthase/poly-beta-1,6-N-acetylglucosamine synthase-like glycosyltransferase n=1 Tax=Desulfobaculum xiamenense TaxID=995050 RepID=A0A846QKH6_9BACT|nr:glycosyltransferase [Desulfobaculum xiamenense]NJB67647.1 glycosyltransferase involved in cell wall biosynthesis/cellulose synthase/poly-beta-1,6-N-acetylglucosamine synthase-like glycosyltransferase [Desulfobaculum xiamenense]
MTLAWIVFALCVMGLAALFVLYPVLLTLRISFVRRGQPQQEQQTQPPTVTVIVAARNAAPLVGDKIANTLGLDYPADRLSLIIVSDGSLDGTFAVARAAADERTTVIEVPEHRGKIHALNLAVREARSDVLVFSDVDAILERDALLWLVAPLADDAIGGVCGRRVIGRDDVRLVLAQERYFHLDSLIKRLESRTGSLTSNDGKLYAVRRELFTPIPEAVTDDLYVALSVVEAGRRFVYEPAAIATVRVPSRTAPHELRRRRRIVGQSLRGVLLRPHLLLPTHYGMFAMGLFINKILRRMMPFLLAGLFASSIPLAAESAWVAVLLAAQTACYLLGALWPFLRRAQGIAHALNRLSQTCFYVMLGNLGMTLGAWDFLCGRSAGRWEPEKDDALCADTAESSSPTIAYVMSRFPKITETFILYELLELERRGMRVLVYPLILHEEPKRHPEVDTIMPRVRTEPFLSGRVIAANVALLTEHPLRYLRAAAEALGGTMGNANHFLRTLILFPKIVWMARDMALCGIRHVHAHFATHPALAALVIKRLAGIGYSITAHAHDIQITTRMLDRKFEEAAFAVTISDFNRSLLANIVGPEATSRIHVIRCGIDPQTFIPREHPDVSPDAAKDAPVNLLCVASYKDMKGHAHLVEACRLLAVRGVPFVCRLVGDGPLRTDVARRIRQADLEREVLMLGPLPRPRVAQLMREADIAVLASVRGARGDMEGIPVFLMEAMACALPVVSTRLSGIPELVEHGETGLLVPPADPIALAWALAELSRASSERIRMGMAGRTKVLRDYDLARNTGRLAQLLTAHADRLVFPATDISQTAREVPE